MNTDPKQNDTDPKQQLEVSRKRAALVTAQKARLRFEKQVKAAEERQSMRVWLKRTEKELQAAHSAHAAHTNRVSAHMQSLLEEAKQEQLPDGLEYQRLWEEAKQEQLSDGLQYQGLARPVLFCVQQGGLVAASGSATANATSKQVRFHPKCSKNASTADNATSQQVTWHLKRS